MGDTPRRVLSRSGRIGRLVADADLIDPSTLVQSHLGASTSFFNFTLEVGRGREEEGEQEEEGRLAGWLGGWLEEGRRGERRRRRREVRRGRRRRVTISQ